MGAAIILGFGFCIGVVLFNLVCGLAGVTFMNWASRPPKPPKPVLTEDQAYWREWRQAALWVLAFTLISSVVIVNI